MAFIMIPISFDVGSLFKTIDIPGINKKVEKTPDHCTLINLGDSNSIKKIIKIIPVLHEITKNKKPFNVTSKMISSFAANKYGIPVIAKLESKELHDLHNEIKKALDKNKIKYETKFKDFKPHVTVGYVENEIDNVKFPKINFQVNNISLCGDNNEIYVNFPFSLNVEKKANYLIELTDEFLKGGQNKKE